MATRLYLPASAASTPIAPTPNGLVWVTTFFERAMTRTSKIADALATVSIDDANSADQSILFRQYISAPLTASQTITGSQACKMQVRVQETDAANNVTLMAFVYVVAADGSTVQKIVVTATRDDVEASAAALENRQWTGTSAATNYTTVAGDRLVIEIGMGGNPTGTAHHDSSMRLGDSSGSDLPEDNTSTDDFNPWFELTDTLTFDSEPLALPTIASTVALTAATLAYAMTLPFIASAAALTPPEVGGTQALSLPEIASGAALNAPTVAYQMSLPSIGSTAVLFAGEVSGGDVPEVLPAITRLGLHATPTGKYSLTASGDINISLPHIASGAALFAPTLAYAVTLPTIGSGAALFAPSLAYAVSLPAIGSTAQLFAPTLTYQVELPAIASGAVLNAPTLAYAVTLPTIGPDTQLFAPTVVESGSLALPHISSTAVLNAPTLAYSMSLPFIGSTAQLFAPSLAVDQALSLPTLASGALLNAPTLAYAISLPTITGTVLNAPSVAYAITLPFIGSTAALFAPTLLYDLVLSLPTIASTVQLFPPAIFTGAIFKPDIELTLNLQRGTALGLLLQRTAELSVDAARRVGLTLETSPD